MVTARKTGTPAGGGGVPVVMEWEEKLEYELDADLGVPAASDVAL